MLVQQNEEVIVSIWRIMRAASTPVSPGTPDALCNTSVFCSLPFRFEALADRQAASHTDCIVLMPSVYLDGVEMQREVVYTPPDLQRLCQEMGVQG